MESYMGAIYIWAVRYAPIDFALCNGATYSAQQYAALFALFGTIYGGDGRTTFQIPNLTNRFPYGSVTGSSSTSGAPNLQIGVSGGALTATQTATVTGTLVPANLPGHTHPATFTPTLSQTQVTVSAPAQTIPVTIPVAASAPSAGPVNPLTTSVYLANATGAASTRGPFQSAASAPTVNLVGGTASGNPGGSFTGSINAVTGGTVAVTSQNTTATAFNATAAVSLPPYLAMNFLLCTQGLYPSPQ